MNKILLFVSGLLLSTLLSFTTKAQTDGTLTFTYTQPAPTSPSGTRNVLAVWIEDNSGTFVKTKMRYWGNGTNDHLPTWKTKSAQNVTDALTGATRTASTNPSAFGVKTVTWDGKDIDSIIVADGTYKIWVESSWQTSLAQNQHNTITSFAFTKGATEEYLNPAGNTYFNSINLAWVPATTSTAKVADTPFLIAYPNPTSGLLSIDYSKVTRIQILNILGNVILDEGTNNNISGTKTIDMRNFSNGVYIINLINGEKSAKYKVLLNK